MISAAAGLPLTVGLSVRQLHDGHATAAGGLVAAVAEVERRHPSIVAIWTSDRVFGPVPTLEPMSLLAALAASTTRVTLGTAVVVLPARNPVALARAAATVDHLSGGRLVLGLGAGSGPDLAAGGFPLRDWGPSYEQAVVTLLELLGGACTTTKTSACRLDDAVVRPSPVQAPLPLWLSGHAVPALDRAARLAVGWVGSGSAGLDRFERGVKRLQQGLDAQERPRLGFTVAKRVYIHLEADDGDDVIEPWSRRLFGDPSVGRRIVVAGSPQRCLDELERLARAGAQHLILDPVVWTPSVIDAIVESVVEPLLRQVS